MAVMTDPQRQEAWADLMRSFPPGTALSLTKNQLRSLVNAADQVLSNEAGSLNSQIQAIDSNWNTLPVPARAFIFNWLVSQRYGKGV